MGTAGRRRQAKGGAFALALALACVTAPAAGQTLFDRERVIIPPQPTAARITQMATPPARPARLRRDDPAPYAPAPVRTLAQALEAAYQHNPRLLAQRAQLRAADHRVAGARAAYGPSLDVTASYGYTDDTTETAAGPLAKSAGWATSMSATLSQPVLTFGRNRAAELSAKAGEDYAREQLLALEIDTMRQVIGDYVGVLRDAALVTSAQRNVALLEREQEDAAKLFAGREITATDVSQIQTRLGTAYGTLMSAKAALAVSQSHFLRDVGAPPGTLAPLPPLPIPVDSIEDAYALADSDSPALLSARARERASRAQMAANAAESRPRLDVQGTAAIGPVSPYSDALHNKRMAVMVVAKVPIFDFGRRHAHYAESRESNQADWLLADAAMRDAHAAVADAWSQHAAARASLSSYRDAADAAARAYEGARIQKRAGARSVFEVLDIARDMLAAEQNHASAVANEYLARANLLAALGQLTIDALSPQTPLYDAQTRSAHIAYGHDLPLITPVLAALDGVTLGALKTNRPVRDTGATLGTRPMISANRPNMTAHQPPQLRYELNAQLF